MDKKSFIKNNKNYVKFGLTVLIVVVLSIVFFRSSEKLNLNVIFQNIKSILAPFIYGIIIAYILNPSLKTIEHKILNRFSKLKKPLKRTLAITLTYILLFSFLFLLISYIIPEISENTQNIIAYLKDFEIKSLTASFSSNFSFLTEIIRDLENYINMFVAKLLDIPLMLNKIVSSTVGLASTIFNFILGIVISMYILSDKENLGLIAKKTLYTFSNKKIANKIIKFCHDSNQTFERFFVGKIIDSSIIGLIFFVGASLLAAPFVPLLSIIIAVTNMIPYFGPFIGGVPVFLITLLADISNPLKSIWIALFIFALQQFDGIILGPKILGNSVGVKPLGIIFSIIVGGAVLGVFGMFFGVPVFALVSSLYTNYINEKYEEKSKE